MPHAQDPFDGVPEVARALGEETLDNAHEGLVDDGGRAAGLTDDGVAFDELCHGRWISRNGTERARPHAEHTGVHVQQEAN